MKNFYWWWHNEGSGITPNEGDDMEAHAERVARIAWENAVYKERESVRELEELGE